ncbi:MAG: glycosyltransferase family 2 protein [Pseudomonadota bacterium]|nr:glycosyltransferase family 2 protein [Pseudomonadota bacterium]
MRISVIVSTYNAPQWLEKALTGFACQSDTDFELLVADDGSGPDTMHLVERFAESAPFPMRHVRQADDGFRKWRIVNRAIEAATGNYLILTDGDCVPRGEFVATHRARARPGRFLSGGYCRLPMRTSQAIAPDDIRTGHAFRLRWLAARGVPPGPQWLKIVARPLHVDGLFNALSPAKRTFNGNNSSCWREDALRVGGFDERIRYGGGDREFGYRLAYCGITPRVIRYSTLCLHLDHARGYKDPAIREQNEAVIAETRASRRQRTEHGIR